MDRWHIRCFLSVMIVLSASFAFGQLGLRKGKVAPAVHQPKCEECGECTPYTCNICHGCHSCCACGCAQSGYCGWCGHGKTLGWSLRNGGILPKCDKRGRFMNYYYGHGYGHGGYGGGPAMGWGGYNADLFYNYYVPQTGVADGVPAEMYPAPHHTPSPTVQTYYTYQPWMPHEMLYEHNRSYIRYHSNGLGATVSHVEWGNSPLRRHKY